MSYKNQKTIEFVYSRQTKKKNIFEINDDIFTNSIINFIEILPNYNMITYLRIHNFNQLTSLPKLPDSLRELRCHNNKLTSLPKLPNLLRELECSNNQLTILPKLPKSLKRLYCSNNQLTVLPKLPKSLRELYCSSNNLTSLPEHNDISNYVYDDETCECGDYASECCDCVKVYYMNNKFITTQKYIYLIQII
jgi:Leucine-rich repeat (LRR) protein